MCLGLLNPDPSLTCYLFFAGVLKVIDEKGRIRIVSQRYGRIRGSGSASVTNVTDPEHCVTNKWCLLGETASSLREVWMGGLVPTGPQLVLQARLVVRHQFVQQEVRKYLRLRLDGIVTLGTPEHKDIP